MKKAALRRPRFESPMTKYVVLLRGINVGGHHKLPMKDLREVLESLGYEDIRTYIQSGNVVLSAESAPDAAAITAAISQRVGFSPRVLVVPADRFEAMAERNPYIEEAVEGKQLHVWFLAGPAASDTDGLDARKSPSEQFMLTEDAFYLYAPDGIGRSRLAKDAEKLLGVEGTGRNWNTVCKLLELLA